MGAGASANNSVRKENPDSTLIRKAIVEYERSKNKDVSEVIANLRFIFDKGEENTNDELKIKDLESLGLGISEGNGYETAGSTATPSVNTDSTYLGDNDNADPAEAIAELAASHILERSLHLSSLMDAKSFSSARIPTPTDTSLRSTDSIKEPVLNLAALLPPPRISFDDINEKATEVSSPTSTATSPGNATQNTQLVKQEDDTDTAQLSSVAGEAENESSKLQECEPIHSKPTGKKLTIQVTSELSNSGEADALIISNSGAMRLDEFNINNNGMEDPTVPNQLLTSYNPRDFIEIKELGRGSGGSVTLSLHRPTMKLVAIKSIAMNNFGKRQQTATELRVLYHNLTDLGSGGGEKKAKFQIDNESHTIKSDEIVKFYGEFVDKGGFVSVLLFLTKKCNN